MQFDVEGQTELVKYGTTFGDRKTPHGVTIDLIDRLVRGTPTDGILTKAGRQIRDSTFLRFTGREKVGNVDSRPPRWEPR